MTLTLDELASIAEQLTPILNADSSGQRSNTLNPENTARAEEIFRRHGVTFTGAGRP